MDIHPDNTAERYDHRNTYVPRLIAAAAALSVFFLIHYLYTADLLLNFDRTVGNAIRSLRGPLMDPLMKSITFMGNWEVLVGTGHRELKVVGRARVRRERHRRYRYHRGEEYD